MNLSSDLSDHFLFEIFVLVDRVPVPFALTSAYALLRYDNTHNKTATLPLPNKPDNSTMYDTTAAISQRQTKFPPVPGCRR